MSSNRCHQLCLVANAPVPSKGGGPGAVVYKLEQGLKESNLNWEVAVVSLNPDKNINKIQSHKDKVNTFIRRMLRNNVIILELFMHLYIYYRIHNNIKKFYKICMKHENQIVNSNIIHCHDIISYYCVTKVLRNNRSDVPVLLSIHSSGSWINEVFNSSLLKSSSFIKERLLTYEENAYQQCLALVLGSCAAIDYLDNDFKKIIDVIENKVHILYSGLVDIKNNQRKNEDIVICTSIGRLEYIKGYDLLIKSISLLDCNNVLVRIVGNGSEYQNLKKLTLDHDLENKIQFLGYRTDVVDILNESDIYISTSRKAMFDLTILEAMRSGLPVIATNVGGNMEALDDTYSILVEKNPIQIENAIKKLVLDYELRYRYGLNARKAFEKKFTRKRMIENAIKIYLKYVGE
jgi:glycosyltransferase involved in cell wall biosynthesis